MNLFDLPGPQFLAFYAVLGMVVVGAIYYLKQLGEAGEPVRLPSSDPYLIAFLRGGAVDTVRLGVTVLVDRKLLAIGTGDTVSRREGVAPMHGSTDLERAILEQCAESQSPADLVASPQLHAIARRLYESPLLHMQLLAGTEARQRRALHAGIAVAVLVTVAAIKVAIGLSRNRPVSFLVISAIMFSALALFMTRGRRTARGDRVLEDLATLFDALRSRASEMRPYTATSELALLVAVFGIGAVPLAAFPFRRAFTPREAATSCGASYSCGSSSSSSCGGGGSSCGGGGGGCGGCGSS